MKTYIPYSLLLAAASCGMAFGAATAYTTPVGYVSLGNAGSVPANTDVYVSIPLERPAEYGGSVSSVSGNTVTLSGSPGFTVNQFASGVPYIVEIGSGAKSGLVALVVSNDAGTVTVAPQPGLSLSGILSGDLLRIRKAWTVSTFLSSTTIPVGTQLLANSGTVPGIVVAPDLIFEYDGANWVDTNTFDSADNVVLYPGEGFVLRTTGSAISSLSVSGEVPSSNHLTVISNFSPGVGQDSSIGYIGAVGEKIGVSGLGYTGGDQLLVWDNTTTGIIKAPVTVLEFDGSVWVDTNTFDDVSTTFELTSGQSYVFRRSPSASGADVVWSDQQTYIPSL